MRFRAPSATGTRRHVPLPPPWSLNPCSLGTSTVQVARGSLSTVLQLVCGARKRTGPAWELRAGAAHGCKGGGSTKRMGCNRGCGEEQQACVCLAGHCLPETRTAVHESGACALHAGCHAGRKNVATRRVALAAPSSTHGAAPSPIHPPDGLLQRCAALPALNGGSHRLVKGSIQHVDCTRGGTDSQWARDCLVGGPVSQARARA